MPRKPVLDWIDTNAAAQMLGTSPQWIRELIQRNKFPNIAKVGRSYVIPRKDFEAYCAKESKRKAEKEKNKKASTPKVQ